MARGITAKDVYDVTINYTHTLSDMIHSGHYDWVNNDITAENFPISTEGVHEANLELVHFNRFMDSEDVLKEFAQAGLEPAQIEHLLAFGAKYPELQRRFPIFAMGSVWRHRRGFRFVLSLWSRAVGRGLGLDSFDRWWDDHYRFLAFRPITELRSGAGASK